MAVASRWVVVLTASVGCANASQGKGDGGSGESSIGDTIAGTSGSANDSGDDSSGTADGDAESGAPCADEDADGHADAACGGNDCNDADAAIHPNAFDFAGRPEWSIDTIDDDVGTRRNTALAIDSGGTSHVSYVDDDGLVLRHAVIGTEGWITVDIDDATGPDYPIHSIALAIHASAVHVAYVGAMGLSHASRDGDSWNATPVPDPDGPDDIGDGVDGTALAVAADGTVHLAYGMAGAVRHATLRDGEWSNGLVDLCVGACSAPAIALAGDEIHLAYRDGYQDALHYAVSIAGWLVRPLEDAQVTDPPPYGAAIAIAPGNGPATAHVSFYSTATRVTRAVGGSDGFTNDIVADVDGIGASIANETTAIAIAGDGTVHILYRSGLPEAALHHAAYTADTWASEIVEAGDTGYSCNLALDANGQLRAAYHAADAGATRHARRLEADGVDQNCDGADG